MRASCFSDEAADVICRSCNEGTLAGEPGYDRKNSWKQKQRKAVKELPGQNKGDHRRRDNDASASDDDEESRAVELHNRLRLHRLVTVVSGKV